MRHPKPIRLTPFDMQAIDRALVYIAENFNKKISADQLAIEVGMAKKKLQAGIRKRTKRTLHQYLVHMRINSSKDLLATTGFPLKAIAETTGFGDESYYCKVFRRVEGISPTEFRIRQVV